MEEENAVGMYDYYGKDEHIVTFMPSLLLAFKDNKLSCEIIRLGIVCPH